MLEHLSLHATSSLICSAPQIERNELAIRICEDGQLNIPDSYRSKINVQMSKNLAVAEENKMIRDENFRASCAKKGEHSVNYEFVRSSVRTILVFLDRTRLTILPQKK